MSKSITAQLSKAAEERVKELEAEKAAAVAAFDARIDEAKRSLKRVAPTEKASPAPRKRKPQAEALPLDETLPPFLQRQTGDAA